MTAGKPRWGGLGALFFLGTLGVIAWYVQRQSIPEERDALRKPATVGPPVSDAEAPPPLPWQDRVDFSALQLLPFGPTPAAAGTAPGQPIDPAAGRLVQDLSDGHRFLTTLDPVLQDAIGTILRNREVPYGAAVVLDVHDNAVLAMVGHSSMDPQVDPIEIVGTAWAPAASTFKLVTAAALLENQLATTQTRACFHGGLHGITDDLLRDDPRLDTQCDTLATAVAQSLNVVIAKLALHHLTQDHLSRTSAALQFGAEIPFELPIEPSPAHFPAEANERAKVAAGFWNVDMSPMHGALLAAVFARRGIWQPPHLLAQIIGPDGSDLTPRRPEPRRVLARDVAEEVGAMMVRTTVDGTARESFRDATGTPYITGVEVAGKTGSLTGKRPPNLNYNWFLGYAPADEPQIAFAVVLANEPRWRIKAHYAARRIVQLWLERRPAIADQREARITPTSLDLPRSDASPPVVAKAAPTPAGPPPAGAPAGAGERAGSAAPPLPPIPGPLPPKADAKASPPPSG
jgi:membrane peptidoglycan carboxypeptidase